MIKSVLQAIPSYVMSVFLLPTTLVDEIEKMINGFWWGNGRSSRRGIHWLSWDKLTVHKNHGGMGFKDLTAFNLAMLGKQGWKFQFQKECLVSKLFKARYFPRSDYLEAKLGHNPSFVWRSIYSARRVVRSGVRWKIGNGVNIPIFDAPWLADGGCISGEGQTVEVIQQAKLDSLINPDTRSWNYNAINYYFDHGIVHRILRTPLFNQVEEDQLIWKAERNGHYSVKSAYHLCMEEIGDISYLHRSGCWSDIWKLKAPPKVKNLIWRIWRGCLPTRDRLLDRGVNCTSMCSMCEGNYEDAIHVLFDCPKARNVWRVSQLQNDVTVAMRNNNTVAEIVFHLIQNLPQIKLENFVTIVWSIWRHGICKFGKMCRKHVKLLWNVRVSC